MPPKKAKQNSMDRLDEPSQSNSMAAERAATTPKKSPSKAPIPGITQAEKQAIIDNYQLEIAERARKLRAQYAEQAQSVHSQMERRINRIPVHLRKRTMGELMDEHAAKVKADSQAMPPPAVPQKKTETQSKRTSTKRTSDQMSSLADDEKENESGDLSNPKKRVKQSHEVPANPPTHQAARDASNASKSSLEKVTESKIPTRSPLKHTSVKEEEAAPAKVEAQPARPADTAKAQPTKALPAKPPAKRQLPTKKKAPELQRMTSFSSTTSSETVMKKGAGTAKGRLAAAKKMTTAAVAKVTGKKPAAAVKREAAPAAATTGRNLRKRA